MAIARFTRSSPVTGTIADRGRQAGLFEDLRAAAVGADDGDTPRPHLVVHRVFIVEIDDHHLLAEVEQPPADPEADPAEAADDDMVGVCGGLGHFPLLPIENGRAQPHEELTERDDAYDWHEEEEHGAEPVSGQVEDVLEEQHAENGVDGLHQVEPVGVAGEGIPDVEDDDGDDQQYQEEDEKAQERREPGSEKKARTVRPMRTRRDRRGAFGATSAVTAPRRFQRRVLRRCPGGSSAPR